VAARLTLLADDLGIDIRSGDALLADARPALAADAVLCQPPVAQREWGFDGLAYDPRWEYGMPPRAESELAWVQHALARLRPGGIAVILLPAGVAVRRPGRRIRAELLRRGALRAVVGLPASWAAPYGPAPHLWILRRPELSSPAPNSVLFVDQSPPADAAVLAGTAERILAAWHAFERSPDGTALDRIAFRKRTAAGWLWFAGSAAGTVLVIVLAEAAPKDHAPAWIGLIMVVCIIFMVVYTRVASRALTPKPGRPFQPPAQVQEAYGYIYGAENGRYPGQPAPYFLPPHTDVPPVAGPPIHDAPPAFAPPPAKPSFTAPPAFAPPVTAPPAFAPPVTAPPAFAPPVTAPPAFTPPVIAPPAAAPNAVDPAAAELQAELRELRDFLGESEGGRARDGRDRRGER